MLVQLKVTWCWSELLWWWQGCVVTRVWKLTLGIAPPSEMITLGWLMVGGWSWHFNSGLFIPALYTFMWIVCPSQLTLHDKMVTTSIFFCSFTVKNCTFVEVLCSTHLPSSSLYIWNADGPEVAGIVCFICVLYKSTLPYGKCKI